MFANLLLINSAGEIGYANNVADFLLDERGESTEITPDDTFRIAHPHDLVEAGSWRRWQNEFVGAQRSEPFPQVLRTYHRSTPAESSEAGFDLAKLSIRFFGTKVGIRRFSRAAGVRGWRASREGLFKSFYAEQIDVRLDYSDWVSDEDDVSGHLDTVEFKNRHFGGIIGHQEVPPLLFSEVMRDLTMIVDQSWLRSDDDSSMKDQMEARRQVVQQAASEANLNQILFDGHHAIMKHESACYQIHLGSGTTTLLPSMGIVVFSPELKQKQADRFGYLEEHLPDTVIVEKVMQLARKAASLEAGQDIFGHDKIEDQDRA